MQAYPSQNATLFRGNSGISDNENVTINGQLGDYSEPRTPNGTGTVTFVSESNVTYLVTGTYNRSTLLRVARSIGQELNSSAASTSANVTNTIALENTLTIESTGDDRVYYNATVSGKMNPDAGADLAQSNASSPDVVTESTASGSTVKRGVDNYTFVGNLTALALRAGPAKVLVNGKQVDPDSFVTATPTATSTPTRTSTSTTTPTAVPTSTSTSSASATTMATASTTPEDSSMNRTPVETITDAQMVAESENGSSGGSSGFGPASVSFRRCLP